MSNENEKRSTSPSYNDAEIARYDAELYKLKYGDKWKKLASTIRDVPQEDGSIVREYVIEDPSLLEELSEDDFADDSKEDEIQASKENVSANARNNELHSLSNQMSAKSYAGFNFKQLNESSADTNQENSKFGYWKPPSPAKQEATHKSTLNLPMQNKHFNTTADKYTENRAHLASKSLSSFNHKSQTLACASKEDLEIDKELETINQQASKNEANDAIVEYEIMDEYGNVIKLDGAEHLKQLAASVKQIPQPDGSIVKEYILNDPMVIERIKNQIKHQKGESSETNMSKPKAPEISEPKMPAEAQQRSPPVKEMITQNENELKKDAFVQNTTKMEALPPKVIKVGNQNASPKFNNFYYANMQMNKSNETLKKGDYPQMVSKSTSNILTTTNGYSPELVNKIDLAKTTTKPYVYVVEQNLTQLDKNRYELITTGGRIVQFMILNDNVTDNEVQEVKEAIEKHIVPSKLASAVDKQTMQSYQQEFKSTYHVPKLNNIKPAQLYQPQVKPTRNYYDAQSMYKSNSLGDLLTTPDSQPIHYNNNRNQEECVNIPINNNFPIDRNYNQNFEQMAKVPEMSSATKIIETHQSAFQRYKNMQKASEMIYKHETQTSLKTQKSYSYSELDSIENSNEAPINAYGNFERKNAYEINGANQQMITNNLNQIKANASASGNFMNIYSNHNNNINNNNNNNNIPKMSNNQGVKMNNMEITPEMTEQLILKLLLQQLILKKNQSAQQNQQQQHYQQQQQQTHPNIPQTANFQSQMSNKIMSPNQHNMNNTTTYNRNQLNNDAASQYAVYNTPNLKPYHVNNYYK